MRIFIFAEKIEKFTMATPEDFTTETYSFGKAALRYIKEAFAPSTTTKAEGSPYTPHTPRAEASKAA
jgi:hypothetical protein